MRKGDQGPTEINKWKLNFKISIDEISFLKCKQQRQLTSVWNAGPQFCFYKLIHHCVSGHLNAYLTTHQSKGREHQAQITKIACCGMKDCNPPWLESVHIFRILEILTHLLYSHKLTTSPFKNEKYNWNK